MGRDPNHHNKMTSRICVNEPRARLAPVQAKKATNPALRSALGEIGNKNALAAHGSVSDKDIKKLVAGQKKAAVKEIPQPKVSEVEAMLTEVKEPEQEVISANVFPDGVLDIDGVEEDQMNPQLCVEYAPAIYSYLREVEEGLSIRKDFLQGYFVNGKMRGVLIDWLIEVHSQFKLLQETLFMTVYVIDKFMQTEGYSVRRNKLQLVGVTAMFISSKVEEMYAPEINDFVYITDNAYTAGEIRQMELKLLAALKFNFSRPLPLHFLRRNSKAGDVDVLQHTVAKYFVELTLLEYDMAHYPPSAVAAAALFLSLRLLEPDSTLSSVWTVTLQHYSTYTGRDLLPIVTKLAQALVRAKENKLQAVRVKYQSKKLMKVSDMPELKGDVVAKLAAKEYNDL